VALANWLIAWLFMVDVQIGTVGYLLTLRPLDAHIRSANPLLAGWVAALICYPPFVLMGGGGVLDYHAGTREWSGWLAGHPGLLWGWGALLVVLTGVYAWATLAFGLRFSNLTYRGVITHGPYRLTRHPAYVAKNLFWWCSTLPFLSAGGSLVDVVRNTVIMALVSAVYYWRAHRGGASAGRGCHLPRLLGLGRAARADHACRRLAAAAPALEALLVVDPARSPPHSPWKRSSSASAGTLPRATISSSGAR
jgi:protein-S-isoprenylcysteine O-methyltransferase Ste14